MGSMSNEEDEGIIPRAIKQIFSTLSQIFSNQRSKRMSTVRISMMEIYNEECKDLLHMVMTTSILFNNDK